MWAAENDVYYLDDHCFRQRFTNNMDDHGERAICEMNVSYPISCVGYLPPSF